MNKQKLKSLLRKATGGCTVQHNGWPCGTCFFAMDKSLTNQDWQALLLYRGDYTRESLDNLPDDTNASLEKIYKIAEQEGSEIMGSVARQKAKDKIIKKLRNITIDIANFDDIETTKIVENEYGLKEGTYSAIDIENLLYFIADMMED